MRIFYSFLIMFVSAILIILPISAGVYDFQTDLREDNFTVTTAVGSDNCTVQLLKPIYDNDTSTITVSSRDVDDEPLYSSYNCTTRALTIIGLAEDATRSLTITYDVDAIPGSNALATFLSYLSFIWIIMWVALPISAIVSIWTGRA